MGSVKLLLNMHFSGNGTNGTLSTQSSVLIAAAWVKRRFCCLIFLILSALFWETSFLCKALGKKVNSFPFLSAWDL